MTTVLVSQCQFIADHPSLQGLKAATSNFFRQFGVPESVAQKYAAEALRVGILLGKDPTLYRDGMLPHLLIALVTQERWIHNLVDLVGELPRWNLSVTAPSSEHTAEFDTAFSKEYGRSVLEVDLRNYQIPLPSLSLAEMRTVCDEQSAIQLQSETIQAVKASLAEIESLLSAKDIDAAAQTLVLQFDWSVELANCAIGEALKALALMCHIDGTPSQGVDQGWHVLLANSFIAEKLGVISLRPQHGTTETRQIERSLLMSRCYGIVFGNPPAVWSLDLWGKPTSLPFSAGDCYNCG